MWALPQSADVQDQTLTLNEGVKWAGEFTDLPVKTSEGKEITYRAVEKDIPPGYKESHFENVLGVTVIVNEYGVTEVTGTKTWLNDDTVHNNSSEVSLKVSRSTDRQNWETLQEDDDYHVDWSGENDSTFTVRGLKKYADAGKTEYVFKVEEDPVPEGYDVSYGENNAIINTRTAVTDDITVEKKWIDNEDAAGLRPKNVTFLLYKEVDGDFVSAGVEPKIISEDGGTATWEDLPVYEADEKIKYKVVEAAVTGYKESFAPAQPIELDGTKGAQKITVSNTFTAEDDVNYLDLVVSKISNKDELLEGAVFTVTAPDGTEKTYPTDAKGLARIRFESEGRYIIKETTAPGGYEAADTTYTVEVDKNKVGVLYDSGKDAWKMIYDLVYSETTKASLGEDVSGNLLYIGNPPAQHKLTIVKNYSGIAELPDTFKVNVSYTDDKGELKPLTLELEDGTVEDGTVEDGTVEDGTVTWTVDDVPYGSNVTVSETGYEVERYKVTASGGVQTFIMPDDDHTVTMTNTYTEQEKITVTYDPDNGDDKQTTEIERGADEPTQPADPTREGYTFGGWERSTDADGNVTYKAKWTPIEKITVTYDPDNGQDKESTEIDRGSNEPAQKKDPYKEGHKFLGWDRTQDENGNVTYKARWEKIPEGESIVITYDKADGSDPEKTTIQRGDKEPAQPEDPTREGYKFEGWERTQDEDGSNVTYTAKWTPIEKITITHDPGNGEPVDKYIIDRGEDEHAQPADPTRDGYTFTGWDRTIDENGNVIYKARWTPVTPPETIKVVYIDPATGEKIIDETVKRTENEPAQPADPTREGYRFTGWQRVQDPESGDVTYTARWEEIPETEQITVTYIDESAPEGEQVIQTETIDKGTPEKPAPDDPTREGYTFGGWERSTDENGNVTYKAKWIENPAEPDQTTSVTVMKKWDDGENRDGVRTKDITVALVIKSGEEQFKAKDMNGADVPDIKLNADGNWTGRFENLPVLDEDGKTIEYSVVETEAPAGYEPKLEGDAKKGYTITNTYVPKTTTVEAYKVWEGEPETKADLLRKDVTLHLFGMKDGSIVYDAGVREIKKGEERAEWKDIPAYSDGSLMTWQVVEDAVEGYTTKITAEENTFTVTNTFTEITDPTVNVSVTKEWQDENNRDGKRPETITYELWKKVGTDEAVKADEKTVGRKADGSYDWNYEWKELPAEELTEDGENAEALPIMYTVMEKDVAGYTGVVEAVAPGEFKAVNYHKPETTSFTIKKAWSDGDDADGIRPSHISVALKADGTVVRNGVLTADGKWEIEMNDLPVYASGKSGQLIAYTVEEAAPDGYAPAYTGTGTADDPLVITNTYTPAEKLTLTVTKEWKDEEGDTSGRKPVVFHLVQVVDGARKQLGAEYDKTIPVDAEGDGLKVTWSELTPMISGKPVTYTVEENAIEGYTTSMSNGTVEGSNIYITVTNTKDATPPEPEPEKITVTHDDGNGHVTTETITKGSSEPAQPADPVRDGYVFGGWDRSEDDKGNVTYKARWTPVPKPGQISVTYKDGDKTISSENITRGDNEPAQPEDLVKAGYTFGGWKRSVDADGNVTYTANWIEDPETAGDQPRVLYVDPMADGDGVNPVLAANRYADKDAAKKAADDHEGAPEDPSHEGYTFTGWLVGTDEFGDYVLIAKYNEEIKPEKTVVTFIDPQSGEMIIKSAEIAEGEDPESIEKPEAPSHENMQFVGWEKTQDAAGNWIYAVRYESDCKNPQPGEKQYWVMYVDPDGKIYMQKTTVKPGEKEPAAPADPVKDGYKFGGWELEEDDNGNKIYSAVWIEEDEKPGTYWVTYVDPDGKTVYLPKMVVQDGEAEPEAPADPTREGYTFDGWDRSVDADGNVTYTAVWKKAEEPGPVDPTDPTEPTDPSDPTDPTKPADPTDPSAPSKSEDTATPTVVPKGANSTVVTNPVTGQTSRVFSPETAASPATGDKNENLIWIIAAIAAGAGIAAAAVMRRRRREE